MVPDPSVGRRVVAHEFQRFLHKLSRLTPSDPETGRRLVFRGA